MAYEDAGAEDAPEVVCIHNPVCVECASEVPVRAGGRAWEDEYFLRGKT